MEPTIIIIMHDLTPSQFHELAAEIAKLNSISTDLAEDIIIAAGDAFDSIDADGRVVVALPDGATMRIIWPEDF